MIHSECFFLFSEKAIKTMIWQYTAKYLIALLEFIGFPKVIMLSSKLMISLVSYLLKSLSLPSEGSFQVTCHMHDLSSPWLRSKDMFITSKVWVVISNLSMCLLVSSPPMRRASFLPESSTIRPLTNPPEMLVLSFCQTFEFLGRKSKFALELPPIMNVTLIVDTTEVCVLFSLRVLCSFQASFL